jgi:hypothetical protein
MRRSGQQRLPGFGSFFGSRGASDLRAESTPRKRQPAPDGVPVAIEGRANPCAHEAPLEGMILVSVMNLSDEQRPVHDPCPDKSGPQPFPSPLNRLLAVSNGRTLPHLLLAGARRLVRRADGVRLPSSAGVMGVHRSSVTLRPGGLLRTGCSSRVGESVHPPSCCSRR